MVGMDTRWREDLPWQRFETASSRYKLRLMIMLTCAVALGLAGIALGGYELSRFRNSLDLDVESKWRYLPPHGALILDESAIGPKSLDHSNLWALGGILLLSLGTSVAAARTLERHIAEPLEGLAAQSVDCSRKANDRLPLEPVAFDLRRFVDTAVDAARQEANSKNLLLECKVDESVPTVVLQHADRLNRVLGHLLGNAVKFTVIGGISVRIAASRRGTLPTLRCVIQDTGVGIPGEMMPTLFEPFTEVEARRSGRHDGRGLGLAVSRRLVDQMDGTLRAASVQGAGSIFVLEVPCEFVKGNPAEVAASVELSEECLPLPVGSDVRSLRTRDLEPVMSRRLPTESVGPNPWAVGPFIDAHNARG